VDRPSVLGPPWTDTGADRGHGGAPKLAGGGAKQRGGLEPHRSSGGAVEAGRRWCRTGRRRRSVRTLVRHVEREKKWGKGVVLLGGGARLL
jgi:hypothetical protein